MGLHLFTVGYAADRWDGFVRRLAPFGITHLVDVRTNPWSRYQEDYRGEEFAARVRSHGMKYVFMGDSLGGKPTREEVLTDGQLDPLKLRADSFFQMGIQRVIEACSNEVNRVCLMCGCGKPEECHRGRIVCQVLHEQGVRVTHILPNGQTCTQADISGAIGADQGSLFVD